MELGFYGVYPGRIFSATVNAALALPARATHVGVLILLHPAGGVLSPRPPRAPPFTTGPSGASLGQGAASGAPEEGALAESVAALGARTGRAQGRAQV